MQSFPPASATGSKYQPSRSTRAVGPVCVSAGAGAAPLAVPLWVSGTGGCCLPSASCFCRRKPDVEERFKSQLNLKFKNIKKTWPQDFFFLWQGGDTWRGEIFFNPLIIVPFYFSFDIYFLKLWLFFLLLSSQSQFSLSLSLQSPEGLLWEPDLTPDFSLTAGNAAIHTFLSLLVPEDCTEAPNAAAPIYWDIASHLIPQPHQA